MTDREEAEIEMKDLEISANEKRSREEGNNVPGSHALIDHTPYARRFIDDRRATESGRGGRCGRFRRVEGLINDVDGSPENEDDHMPLDHKRKRGSLPQNSGQEVE